ncbi:hypothetical protein BDP27DRAFT_1528361, partial [Rhodocollybia butyracea]
KAPIYAFFHADPDVDFDNDGTAEYVTFSCAACRTQVRQGHKTTDKASTGALIRHAKSCWGDKAVSAVQQSKSLDKARDAIGRKGQSKLTAALRTVKGWAESKVTQPPTKKSIRFAARPFRLVEDRCYCWLQREGRPTQYIPSKEMVSRDVKHLYQQTKEKLAQELQVSEIAIDCWTSPNHRTWMSTTTSRIRKGTGGHKELVTHLLDSIELPCSHSAINMATPHTPSRPR